MSQFENEDLIINLNPDTTPVLYTDNIVMNISEDGLILDVCQRMTGSNQMKVVSRIGMSKSHAKKFLQKLSTLIQESEGQIMSGKKILA